MLKSNTDSVKSSQAEFEKRSFKENGLKCFPADNLEGQDEPEKGREFDWGQLLISLRHASGILSTCTLHKEQLIYKKFGW